MNKKTILTIVIIVILVVVGIILVKNMPAQKTTKTTVSKETVTSQGYNDDPIKFNPEPTTMPVGTVLPK